MLARTLPPSCILAAVPALPVLLCPPRLCAEYLPCQRVRESACGVTTVLSWPPGRAGEIWSQPHGRAWGFSLSPSPSTACTNPGHS